MRLTRFKIAIISVMWFLAILYERASEIIKDKIFFQIYFLKVLRGCLKICKCWYIEFTKFGISLEFDMIKSNQIKKDEYWPEHWIQNKKLIYKQISTNFLFEKFSKILLKNPENKQCLFKAINSLKCQIFFFCLIKKSLKIFGTKLWKLSFYILYNILYFNPRKLDYLGKFQKLDYFSNDILY